MVLADIAELDCREAARRLGDIRDQNPAAAIERLDREAAVPRGEYHRRSDKAHSQPRIAAGKLEARGQEDAAPVVKRMGQRVVLALIGADPGLALDANAAAGRIAGALHRSLCLSAASEGTRLGQKWQRPPGIPRRPCGTQNSGRPGYTGHHQPVVRENAFMGLM